MDTAHLLELLARRELSLGSALGVTHDELARLAAAGRSQRAAGRHADAVTVFEGLVALDPSLWPLAYELGLSYEAAGRLADAERAFDDAIALAGAPSSQSYLAYMSRGLVRERRGDAPRARADLSAAHARATDPLCMQVIAQALARLAREGKS